MNSIDHHDATPLHQARNVLFDKPEAAEIIKLLLDNGADLHIRDDDGETARNVWRAGPSPEDRAERAVLGRARDENDLRGLIVPEHIRSQYRSCIDERVQGCIEQDRRISALFTAAKAALRRR